ncbi:sulfurtransferase TusA family protein [Saccharospirillum mangrovi]|uniref:sulfurtransferase TusA family protein n=1 Tax=Saccharospirillum mangrovi TaxID=2161747 RepID=UPI0018E57CD4|nr:sulfurtransferase TusA family protein [Saccharospirillum mangrovi]
MSCKTKATYCLDVRGLRCPLPLLRTKQQLLKMDPGAVLEVWATDAGSWRDIPAYLAISEHRLLEQHETVDGEYHYCIERGVD